jgi:hypothetical protein
LAAPKVRVRPRACKSSRQQPAPSNKKHAHAGPEGETT